MRGVAPGAALVNLQGQNPALLSESQFAATFEWILAHRTDPRFPGGIRVANMSIAVDSEMPLVRRFLGEAIEAGIVVVAASGNFGKTRGIDWPAAYPEVIAVGAACKDADNWSHRAALDWAGVPGVGLAEPMCRDDRVWTYSARGATLDLVAPGVDVWSAWHPSATGLAGSGFGPTYRPPAPGAGNFEDETNNRRWYAWSIGTSAAAPHVTGVVALMLEANRCLTPARVEQILRQTAKDLGPAGFDEASGYGRVDALAAVRAAERALPRHKCSS